MSYLLDFGILGFIFLGIAFWLIRRVVRAARMERDLEEQRLTGAFAEELAAGRARAEGQAPPLELVLPPTPLAHADLRDARPEHVALVKRLAGERDAQLAAQHAGPVEVPLRVEVLWVRSTATHVAWCERRHAATLAAAGMTREVICVASVVHGEPTDRWSF